MPTYATAPPVQSHHQHSSMCQAKSRLFWHSLRGLDMLGGVLPQQHVVAIHCHRHISCIADGSVMPDRADTYTSRELQFVTGMAIGSCPGRLQTLISACTSSTGNACTFALCSSLSALRGLTCLTPVCVLTCKASYIAEDCTGPSAYTSGCKHTQSKPPFTCVCADATTINRHTLC